MAPMRFQSLINTNTGIQITYVLESDIHEDSGVVTARTLDIPHEALPQPLLDEVIDIVAQIVEHARVVTRGTAEAFRAQR